MDQMERTIIQQQFMNDQIDVICSTSAFGMGIDKPNIRLVIHYHFPLQLEDYIQEVGRAGRDGKSSVSLLLYAKKDEAIPLSLIHKQLPTTDELLTVFNKLYQLYQRQSSIPKKEEDAAALFDLEEIQWRFLHFQLECHGILRDTSIVYHARNWEKAYDSLCNLIEQRLNIKKSKRSEEHTSELQSPTRRSSDLLYQRQSSIPKKEEDAAALFDLEEIQWRFLHFQLECHGILRDTSIVYHARNWEKAYDSLCNLIEQRLNIKKSK